MNNAIKWSSQQTLEFVHAYGQLPCLWDPGHPQYKDREARDAALQSLVNLFRAYFPDFDVQSARKKIRILRSTYWNEKTKMEKSRRNAAHLYGCYTSKLSWFWLLNQFLTSATGASKPEAVHMDELSAMDELNAVDGSPERKRPRAEEQFDPIPLLEPKTEPCSSDGVLESSAAPKQEPCLFELSTAPLPPVAPCTELPCTEDAEDGPQFAEQRPAEHEFEAFGRSVAAQLRQFPLQVAVELQLQVQTLITHRRLQLLREVGEPPQ